MPRGKRRGDAIKDDTFAAVIRAYMMSPKYDALADKTRQGYSHLLRSAEAGLGKIPIEIIRPSMVQAFLDGYADRPGQQRVALAVIRSLEKWAIVRDRLPRQISLGCEAPGSEGGHEPWPDQLVALAELECRPHLSRVITLAANTGQRGSDLVKMHWSDFEDYEGRSGINVLQKKTKKRLWIPMTQELARVAAGWKREMSTILVKEDGLPFTRKQLSDQWLRERDGRPALAAIAEAGLVLHGLRGTACVRLLRAGAHTRQIADMVGMSEQMVKRYTRFAAQRDNALAAVRYLDKTEPEHKVLKFPGRTD